ncbi:hypothetical protein Tco_0005711 [Tanacetum coccineum]
MTGAKFEIEQFDGTGNFGLWRIKMRALLIQHRCEAALEVLPEDMKAQAKIELNKKSSQDHKNHHTNPFRRDLCLGNTNGLREVPVGDDLQWGFGKSRDFVYDKVNSAQQVIPEERKVVYIMYAVWTKDFRAYRCVQLNTDISKITRKPSKSGKHGHEKRKSTRSQRFKAKAKESQLQSTMGQLIRRQIPKYSI